MFTKLAVENLRQRISSLEETQRRFSRTISVADAVDRWLPHGGLSAGCIHEVKGISLANAIAFSAILSSRLTGDQGNVLYIAPDRSLHPLGLLPYGLNLDRLLHVSTRRSPDLVWTVMEALRCPQVSAVIALISGLDLTESRRLQLAAEASGTTGFFLGHAASSPIASPVTRWRVSAVVDKADRRFDEPVWALDLLYCRGGRPGSWTLEWRDQKLNALPAQPAKQAAREALAG
jgi:protein ImuA